MLQLAVTAIWSTAVFLAVALAWVADPSAWGIWCAVCVIAVLRLYDVLGFGGASGSRRG